MVHLQRNILSSVKPKHKGLVAEEFKNVFRTDDRNDTKEGAKKRYISFLESWREFYPSFKNRLHNERIDFYFTYVGYHHSIRSMIYTTNWIERLNRDFKRTTRMRGALPNPEATILLLGGVAMSRKAYLRKVPKMKNEKEKFEWNEDE